MPADSVGALRTLEFTASEDALVQALISERGLCFTVGEARQLVDLLGRNPTVLEAHLFDTMWSEHCSYKSSRPVLKRFLPTDSSFVVLGPVEDAGVVEIGEVNGVRWAAVMGHESHNHPSQIVPGEGAATGIGGIVRDVYCMGADVFAVLDSLRFGDLDGPDGERSREILTGVVEGIAGYANPLGVPNCGGETVFHRGYGDNCLVNVVCAGVMPVDHLVHSAVPERARTEPYDFILTGKATDASGFGGATMASRILEVEEDSRSAVQVPDPFLKRVLRNASLAVMERAREMDLEIGFKDLGAGGIVCVAAEIAHSGGVGVEIRLDEVHVAEDGLGPEVIACAETQERFGWAVPRSFTDEVLRIHNEEFDLPRVSRGAAARHVGEFLPDHPGMRVFWNGELVGDAATEAVTAGVTAVRDAAPARDEDPGEVVFHGDLRRLALEVLASENIASKRDLFSHYDQEVRGGAFLRPGEADAGVALPVPGAPLGVALSVDGNPRYGERNAYWGGANAVLESARNVVAAGAWPRALTDCLNFGNPERAEVYRDFRDAVRGMSDAARGFGTLERPGEPLPFVSGNVSFYNESSTGRAIPPSPIVCCLGVAPDARRCRAIALERVGSRVVRVGHGRDELGGSEAARILHQEERGRVPTADFGAEATFARAVLECIEAGSVGGSHDISSGGLFTALAEMLLGPRGSMERGLAVDIRALPGRGDFEKLFSETGAYLLEVPGDGPLPPSLAEVPCEVVGTVTDQPGLRILGDSGEYEFSAQELESAWRDSFAEVAG